MDITLERILELLPLNADGKIKHGARAEFAKSIGLKSGNLISDWVNGRSASYRDYLYQIAAVYGVSVEWLRGETDERQPVATAEGGEVQRMFDELDEHGRQLVRTVLELEHARVMAARIAEAEPEEEPEPERMIRHYLTAAAAGYAAPIEGEDFELVPLPKDAPKDADYCIEVEGDSMEPYIHDGQRVYVSEKEVPEEFQAGVWWVDGDVLCKQWCSDFVGNLYLISANPWREDANRTVPRSETGRVICFGRVLGLPRLPMPNYGRWRR